MRTALLLIDLQEDYLARPDLVPARQALVARVSELLIACRTASVQVLHVVTLIQSDGANRMPHWREAGKMACVEGTPGARPPVLLAPLPGEAVLPKPYFSAFDSPALARTLAASGTERLVLAGVYTHACIRATALDAYARGFQVIVASDAVGSYDPVHADISSDYLEGRAASFRTVVEIVAGLRRARRGRRPSKSRTPVWQHRNAACWNEVLREVPLMRADEVASYVARSHGSSRAGTGVPVAQRYRQLVRWSVLLKRNEQELVQMITRDVAKPVTDARAEMAYALALLERTIESRAAERPLNLSPGTEVAFRPLGTVALITPFNNPVAIPVGKLAPALAFGNSILWKPALAGTALARRLVELLVESGFDAEVQCLSGGAETAQALIASPEVGAVSFTGAIASGQNVAAGCARYGKRLQAELGGNNAVVVMDDIDVPDVARQLALSLFSFSAQRCTAPRRVIAHRRIRARLECELSERIAELRLGLPKDPETQLGPLLSRESQARMAALVASGIAAGGRLICGGTAPQAFPAGCWFEPTLIANPAPDSDVVTGESFGPVAVLLGADDFDAALRLCNAVSHGLVATLFSERPSHQRRFRAEAEAGILALNCTPFPIDPGAPFGGWKASGIGLPEHGPWDQDFYTRPQAIYQPSKRKTE